MDFDWSPLREELKVWHRHNLKLPVWWRDDDAIICTPQLERLAMVSENVGMPVHLAVIPKFAKQELADFLNERDQFIPIVHGWAHESHEPDEELNNEFGPARTLSDRGEEAIRALRTLHSLFGDRIAPMFAAPWNRVGDDFPPELARAGFKTLSTCNPRPDAEAAPGLQVINTHIDPIYWGPAKQLSRPDLIIDKTVRFLKRRRQGKHDNTEPFGYLTHHLVHTPKIWKFTREYWLELTEGPVEIYRHPQGIHFDTLS